MPLLLIILITALLASTLFITVRYSVKFNMKHEYALPLALLSLCVWFCIFILFGYVLIELHRKPSSRQETEFTKEKIEIEGHTYILFDFPRTNTKSIVHDPDCICRTLSVKTTENTFSEWSKLQMAIAMTESRFNPLVEGKNKDRGIFQQTPIYIREANRIIGEAKYTHDDAFDIAKSVEMFNIVQGYHNKGHDINKAIRLHNHGTGGEYSAAVMKNLAFIERMETVREIINKYEK